MEALKPARVVRPGQILDRELKARGWTQKDLAEIMDRPVQAINEIIAGAKQITPSTAHELAQVFGTSAELWMNLETNYRLFLARSESDNSIPRKSRLYSIAPVKELVRRMWIKSGDSVDELEAAVCAFLEIKNPDEQPTLAASCRHSTARDAAAIAQIATIKRGTHLARAQRLGSPFRKDRLASEIPDLLKLAKNASGVAAVPEWFISRGVHFAIVPHLPQSFLDGAFFTLETGPAILLTLRYDRIDYFWFTLIHEVGHLFHGHMGVFLDNMDNLKDDKQENEADSFASDRLIEMPAYRAFVLSARPFFSRHAISSFADKIGRHPGIVLGRLQFEKHIPFMNLRGLLERVSPHLEKWIDRPRPGKTVVMGS